MLAAFRLFLTVVIHCGLTWWLYFIFLLDLYTAWWLWPVLDGSGLFKTVCLLFNDFCGFNVAIVNFFSVLDCSGLLKMVGVGSCKTYIFSSPVLAWFTCCMMVMASSGWFWPVKNSCACFWMDFGNLLWPLIVLYGVGCFSLILDGRDTLCPDMWIVFYINSWFICCLIVMASSRKLCLLFNSVGRFNVAVDHSVRCWIVLACSRW